MFYKIFFIIQIIIIYCFTAFSQQIDEKNILFKIAKNKRIKTITKYTINTKNSTTEKRYKLIFDENGLLKGQETYKFNGVITSLDHEEYIYNDMGQIILTYRTNSEGQTIKTVYQYDRLGREQNKITTINNRLIEMYVKKYNDIDQILSEEHSNANSVFLTKQYKYNSQGLISEIIAKETSSESNLFEDFQYDETKNLVEYISASGIKFSYNYIYDTINNQKQLSEIIEYSKGVEKTIEKYSYLKNGILEKIEKYMLYRISNERNKEESKIVYFFEYEYF